MGEYATYFRISGNIGVLKRKPIVRDQSKGESNERFGEEEQSKREQEIKVWIEQKKINDATSKRKRREIFAELNKDDISIDADKLIKILRDSNACMTHLIYFCNACSIAKEGNHEVCYGVFKRQMKIDDMQKVWKSITKAFSRLNSNATFICSIGVRAKGVVVLKLLFTNNSETDKAEADFYKAIKLVSRREFKREVILIGEKSNALVESYTAEFKDLEEILSKHYNNLLETFRASLRVPVRNSITFRNKKAETEIKTRTIVTSDNVDYLATCGNSYAGKVLQGSRSGYCLCEVADVDEDGIITNASKLFTQHELELMEEEGRLPLSSSNLEKGMDF